MLAALQRAPAAAASRALLALQQQSHSAFSSASSPDEDYSLVLRKAFEVSVMRSTNLPKVETGYTFGVPLETFKRTARILSPARVAGQQGLGNPRGGAPAWRIEFDTEAKWANPLTGWTSSADPLENVGRSTLFFYSAAEAVAFAEKAGWPYEVIEPKARRPDRPKRYAQYGDNYKWRGGGK